VLTRELSPSECSASVTVNEMFSGYGWCVLKTARPAVAAAPEADLDRADEADAAFWAEFRRYMGEVDFPWVDWKLLDHLNNQSGVLTFATSRNHRRSDVFDMLAWIAEHGPASYGLLYVEDMEDEPPRAERRDATGDFSNVFCVHRLMNGEVTEMADPFFGPISPGLRPD
jgi:Immunity protein 7